MFESNQAFQNCNFKQFCGLFRFSQKRALHTVMFFSAMMGPTLVWLWFCSLRRIDGFATQSTWVASNATGTLAGWVSCTGETLDFFFLQMAVKLICWWGRILWMLL